MSVILKSNIEEIKKEHTLNKKDIDLFLSVDNIKSFRLITVH